jgi:hypothetical protein
MLEPGDAYQSACALGRHTIMGSEMYSDPNRRVGRPPHRMTVFWLDALNLRDFLVEFKTDYNVSVFFFRFSEVFLPVLNT